MALAPSLASATPVATPVATPTAKPTVTSVQKQLGQLAQQNSQLVEKFDQARVAVDKRDAAVTAANIAATKARDESATAHARFLQIIQGQYESQAPLGATSALLDSNSGTNYLDRLATLDMVSAHTAQVVTAVTHARNAASAAAKTAQRMLADAKARRDSLAQKRTAVKAQMTKYRKLLATLNAAQQAAYQRAANQSASHGSLKAARVLLKAMSAAARKAVTYALAQVGKPYVFGAAGPGSYDCSGLTMGAWNAGGVHLPHSAADQYNYGHHVSVNALQPGDLVFLYRPIGHVTIYIGDGLMVSAPTEGQNVSVVPLNAFASDVTGATRLT